MTYNENRIVNTNWRLGKMKTAMLAIAYIAAGLSVVGIMLSLKKIIEEVRK